MNSKFAVGVHILTLLEKGAGNPVTSERMAGSINTHPTLVRRLLSTLAASGLTLSQKGAGGGALLAMPADRITLLDVYRAVSEAELVDLHHAAPTPNPHCPVGRNIQASLSEHYAKATDALEAELSRVTIADILESVELNESLRSATSS